MFTKLYDTSDYPLYTYNRHKKKLLRTLVDESSISICKKKLNELSLIIKKNKITKNFDIKLIYLFLSYKIREDHYDLICHNVISEYLKKKTKIKSISIKKKFQILLRSIRNILKFFCFILITNYFKSEQKKRKKIYNLIIQYFFGNSEKSRKDFPFLKKLLLKKKNIKFLYLLHEDPPEGIGKDFLKQNRNYINKNHSKLIRNKHYKITSLSKQTKNFINFIKSNWKKNPYIFTMLLEFIMDYEYYFQLFKTNQTKVYIHSLTYEHNIAAIRQAIIDNNGHAVNFQRSYYDSNSTSFLQQPDEILFSWGISSEKKINIKKNYIKKLIKFDPIYFKALKLNNKKTLKKTISIFDSTIHPGGHISIEEYNNFMNFILKQVSKFNNINLLIKYKYPFTKNYLNKENKKLIKYFIKKNKCKEILKSYLNNNSVIGMSDLVLSINNIGIGAEALYNKKDSLCYNNKFLKNLNDLYPFAYKNFEKFKVSFNKKLQFKINEKKINLLKDYFFEKNIKKIDPVKYIKNLLNK